MYPVYDCSRFTAGSKPGRSHFRSALDGAVERCIVGKLQIGADRDAVSQACNLDMEGLEKIHLRKEPGYPNY